MFKWAHVILFLAVILMTSLTGYGQTSGPPGDPIIIRIIALDHADAEQIALTLEPFLSAQGRIRAYAPSNSLIIRDRQSIVEKLVRVIKGKLDP